MSDQGPGRPPQVPFSSATSRSSGDEPNTRIAELDEFLSRAVDRQIAEQRALREAFVELADQVRALQSEQGDEVDPEELLEQIRRIHQAYSDVVVAEVREIRDAIAAAAQAEEHEEAVAPEEVIEQIRRISQAYSDAVIAEVRDVKEAIATRPDTPAADEVDPQEFIEQIRRFSQAYSDAVIAEIREVRETMAEPQAPAPAAPAIDAAATDEIAAEIRELREALASQAEATHALATQARAGTVVPMPQVDATGAMGHEIDPDEVIDQIRRISQAYSDAVIAEIREIREGFETAAAPPAATPSSEGSDVVIAELRDVRDEILTQLQRPVPQADSAGDAAGLGDIQGTVGAMSADVEGIAQALIDLNAGLRDWAEGVDSRIGEMQQAVDLVRDFASQTQELRTEMLEAMDLRDQRQGYDAEGYEAEGYERQEPAPSQELAPQEFAVDAELVPEPRVVITDSVELDRRIQETIDLSLYLADQVDAFGRVLQSMGDLPTRLEGVISQALRRTLTARSKLDSEATTEIRTALASLDTYVDKIDDIVTRFAASEESVRKLALGQVEVSSRIDSLYDAIADRLDDVEADRRRTEEILAGAIDAVGEGKAPKAASTLAKATKSAASRRKKTPGSRREATTKAKKPKPVARKRTPRKQANT
ncbi:MAG: hypothetical protein WD826_07945 [Actinomycetota bacterium]